MITVFGSIHLDCSTRVPRLPRPGETALGQAYRLSPGGKGANQALAAKRAGGHVALVGTVGRDAFAEQALDLLEQAQIDLTGVTRRLGLPTGFAMIAVDERGENLIAVAQGANLDTKAADLGDRLDHWSLLVTQMELSEHGVVAAITRAREVEARVVLNLAPPVALSESVLDAVDVLVLNRQEAETVARGFALSAGDPRRLAGALADRRRGPVIVTAGAAGAYIAQGRLDIVDIPSPAVEVVDTTGAGDAFVGALAAGLDRGMPLLEAARLGVAAGALACTGLGAQPAFPHRPEIEDLANRILAR